MFDFETFFLVLNHQIMTLCTTLWCCWVETFTRKFWITFIFHHVCVAWTASPWRSCTMIGQLTQSVHVQLFFDSWLVAVSLHSSESKRFVICTCTLSFYYSFKDMVENTNPLDSRNRHSSTTFYSGFVVFTFPETFAILKKK